jgi:hypothetical protein
VPGKNDREMGRNGDAEKEARRDIRISGNGPELFSLII